MLYTLLVDVTHPLVLNTQMQMTPISVLDPDFSPNHYICIHILFPGHLPLAISGLKYVILILSMEAVGS